jgi:outer membrane immunogenic protein
VIYLNSGAAMKRTFLLGAAFVLMAGAAQAADLPRKMPVKAPPAPMWSWTGFYIGGYYGTGLGQSEVTSDVSLGSVELNDGSITVGGTLGYNWQFSPAGLVGIEGDIGYLGTKRSNVDFDVAATTFGVKSSWYATLRGRLGYVTGPSLLYVTGGGAWVRLEETFGLAAAPSVLKDTDSGWTAGVGIETKLSRGWTAKTEYLYIDLGSTSLAGNTNLTNQIGAANQVATFDNNFHVIKTGLNYKFGESFELPFFMAPLSSPQRWAGFYAGVNAGGGISNVHVPTSTFLSGLGETDVNGTGFAGGGHLGFNWVAFSNWIVGLEGDIGYLGVNRSYTDWDNAGAFGKVLYQPGIDTDWYGTARVRVGTSTGPAFLYATAGLAAVSVENSLVVGADRFSVDGTRVGWTIGGGIETELSSRWSARLESLYMDVGKETVAAPTGEVAEFKNRFTVVRAGLSYKFGGPDVVSTRY